MQISNEVLAEVRQLVAECLAIELEDVRAESWFFSELNGESIDLIELKFRLEKRFGFQLPLLELKSDEYTLDAEARLTSASAALLRGKFPSLKLAGLETHKLERRGDFLTIEMIAAFVQTALDAEKQQAAPLDAV